MGNFASKEVPLTISYPGSFGSKKVVELPLLETRHTATTIQKSYDFSILPKIIEEMAKEGKTGPIKVDFTANSMRLIASAPGSKPVTLAFTSLLLSGAFVFAINGKSFADAITRAGHARAANTLSQAGYSNQATIQLLNPHILAKKADIGEIRPDVSIAGRIQARIKSQAQS
ncbi:hypothetical protein G7Y89_g5500 [Cudoniella acicularis]|uniref:Uncharacterized protein n=1 Tax=Cudoniella acicularis TaxID=354080 RepID=A0A8H4RPJ1_9HELO|nr:hypothetical protein G7Y89_g5500 [Cudoniella acicularis]